MTFSMRPSRLLRVLREGRVAYTFKNNLADPRACEIAARFGFDGIWTCLEHVPNGMAVIESQVQVTKACGVDLVCRVARGSYSDYIRPLEMDAAGIMVPHVMSLADARHVVRMVRFHPVGRRPLDGGNADGFYCNIPLADYLAQANRERLVILQIEDPEPLDELDALAAVEGYDVLFFGPGDFSHSIGAPGEMNHPQVVSARRRVADAARRHGKFAGTVATPATREELIGLGYTLLNMGGDVLGLSQYCRQMAEACGLQAAAQPAGVYGGRP